MLHCMLYTGKRERKDRLASTRWWLGRHWMNECEVVHLLLLNTTYWSISRRVSSGSSLLGWLGLCCVVLVLLQVFAEGDEEDEDGDADEPPAPVVKLRGKKVSTHHHVQRHRGGRACLPGRRCFWQCVALRCAGLGLAGRRHLR